MAEAYNLHRSKNSKIIWMVKGGKIVNYNKWAGEGKYLSYSVQPDPGKYGNYDAVVFISSGLGFSTGFSVPNANLNYRMFVKGTVGLVLTATRNSTLRCIMTGGESRQVSSSSLSYGPIGYPNFVEATNVYVNPNTQYFFSLYCGNSNISTVYTVYLYFYPDVDMYIEKL